MVRPYFTARDIAHMWTQERNRDMGDHTSGRGPVAWRTVVTYARYSRPGGRYADFPMPAPTYPNDDAARLGQHPQWYPPDGQTLDDLEQELRRWWRNRPKRRSPGRPKEYGPDVIGRIRELAAQGSTDAAIATELAIPVKTVGNLRRENQIDAGGGSRTSG